MTCPNCGRENTTEARFCVLWRGPGSVAARGEPDEAVTLARKAAASSAGSDDPTAAETLVEVSEVLRAAGDRAGAEGALTEATALHERKGNVVAARRCRERLAAMT